MKNKESAFTLIELVMVVVVIVILAAIGIPNYVKSKNKSFQKEAVSNLALIAAAERIYRLEYGDYVSCANATDCNNMLKLMLNGATWSYAVTTAGGNTTKTANATATKDPCTYSFPNSSFDGSPTASAGCN